MDRTEKCLEMLKNPKAYKRYEACEELRVGDNSNEKVVDALEKLTNDPDPEVAYAAVRALNSEANKAVLASLGKQPPALASNRVP